jgi:hypothetical protein
MKEVGVVHWNAPNTGATNSSGFTGLATGYRHPSDGVFYAIGDRNDFWSSGSGSAYRLFYTDTSLLSQHWGNRAGLSVRLVRDIV